LQPMFTGIGIAGFLLYQRYRGKSVLEEMQQTFSSKVTIPAVMMRKMELHMAIFTFIYGLFMGGLAIKASTSMWLFFRTAGFYAASGVFFIFEMIMVRRWVAAQR